jgi:hypothetical protein
LGASSRCTAARPSSRRRACQRPGRPAGGASQAGSMRAAAARTCGPFSPLLAPGAPPPAPAAGSAHRSRSGWRPRPGTAGPSRLLRARVCGAAGAARLGVRAAGETPGDARSRFALRLAVGGDRGNNRQVQAKCCGGGMQIGEGRQLRSPRPARASKRAPAYITWSRPACPAPIAPLAASTAAHRIASRSCWRSAARVRTSPLPSSPAGLPRCAQPTAPRAQPPGRPAPALVCAASSTSGPTAPRE